MRKVSEKTAEGLLNYEPISMGNTRVVVNDGVCELILHNSVIARIEDFNLSINNCGYLTNVTKERLNAILEVEECYKTIKQVKGVWYIINTIDNEKTIMPNNEWVSIS